VVIADFSPSRQLYRLFSSDHTADAACFSINNVAV
jgi:hypothetical protein